MRKDRCAVDSNTQKDTSAHDNYKRRINYLRLSITDRCNLRCFYCMPEQGVKQLRHKEILRYEELLRLIRIFTGIGINKIRITGGEPLVRKGVVDFIKDVSQIEGVNDLSLTTNGMLLEKMARDLFDAGVKRINVSLDSLKKEKYYDITRSGSLSQVLAGLKKAQEVGFSPIKVNAVVIRGVNDDEVIDFAKMTEEHPFSIRFIEYMQIGEKSKWDKKLFVSSSEIKSRIEEYSKLELVDKTDKSSPSTDYKIPGAKGTLGFISPLSEHFCMLCNRLRLTADGKLRNCLFSENEIDLKEALRLNDDDEAVSQIIRAAICAKPEGYEKIEKDSSKKRSMHTIGG